MFKLPPLPYKYDALEPYIDTLTMQLHHDKHHKNYVDALNKALEKHPEIQDKDLFKLLAKLDAIPADIRQDVRNNGGGHLNHSMFWLLMTNKSTGKPSNSLDALIAKKFGSFENFKKQFNEAAKKTFGSGWVWLSLDSKDNLIITTTQNQDNPISQGLRPLLGVDLWEHAYYLKYHNKRPDYLEAWWKVVNWDQVEKNYQNFRAKAARVKLAHSSKN